MTARFIAVVGPSGAGKDSLIDAARRHFGEDGPIRFVQRAITRPADAGGEAHEALTAEEFAARAASGGFALHWEAHGLSYGIPADIRDSLAVGRSVLANLSRAAISQMRQEFPERRILVVTASPAVLAGRLAARGRESAAEIEARLSRAPTEFPEGPDVVTVRNEGPLAEAERAFIAALHG
ncbi:phosphonate metabolism protein/1,5-bisphosphokinase (PRPP-forming) PhnN [Rhodospirillaceae bacterium KN72]|uniref:Ribose 1,5-bisphosphate phosphokinase PhnN n=1 Tax=Pacificispira spongiicola TaxID=2729598 RepID=A0A7Y0E0H7_9PROT|nr:phosphonate metabolism protein/1,5-bisphosphokinase (PRPP-forming) PhnN [Pacificispira spongiicola]NMM44221.1 phosphonate metabolism protein/1,5-bisphosphokinase (PRPP-forming) PhnN [Pacificispira spongiicola]